jgi:predicted dehydrogenase
VSGKEWKLDPEQRAGGALGNLGPHLIDLARYFLDTGRGLPTPQAGDWRVWARCDVIGEPSPGGADDRVNDLTWLHLEMRVPLPHGATEQGVPAQHTRLVQARFQVSQLHELRASDPVRLEVHGTAGSAIGYANPLAPPTQRVSFIPRTSAPPEPVLPLEFPGGTPMAPSAAQPSGDLLRPTIRHLYAAYILPSLSGSAGADPGAPSFLDGVIAQRVMDAALSSSQSGTWVTV